MFILLIHLVCKDRDDAIKDIDEQCIQLYNLKLKVLNMINRKIELEENPYFLHADQGKAFGYHKVFIQNILEGLWKEPEVMYYIISKCDKEDMRENLSSFIVNNFYDNILSSSYIEDNLLYLLTLLLKDEINQLDDGTNTNKFLNGTKCGFLFNHLFKQNDIQVFFKAILLKTVEKLEVLNSNRKITFDVGQKEKELIKFKDNYIKKDGSQKSKKVGNKIELFKDVINNIIFENFSCNRMDLIDNLCANKIDHETFISKYIPDLGVKELNNRIEKNKDSNTKIISYYQMQIDQIQKKDNPNLFSNKKFMMNLQSLKLSVYVLTFYQTDFSLIIAYIEEIIKNLVNNTHLLPYSVKCICKIIYILISKKFPDINEIQKNAFVSCFFFDKLLAPILSNPAIYALISEFIISRNTLHNLNIICNIILKLTSGNLFEDNPDEADYTPFNWFFLDKMSELLVFFGHITKVSLPDFIDKLINDKLEEDYRFDYFEENPDEVVTQISICYNVDNLITLLDCIENNKKEIFDLIVDPTKLFSSSFQRLYKPENIEKIKSFGTSKPDLDQSVLNNIAINKSASLINYFLFTKRIVNEKYKLLFEIDAKLYQNFHIKEIEEPKTETDINKNIVIKVKNYISNCLYNYRLLEKNDFDEGTTNNTFQIFKELKRFMKSSNFIVDNSIPSIWYINSLLSYLKKLPNEYKENDFKRLYDELKVDIQRNIEVLDFQSLILFHNKLKFLSRATKHYKVAKQLVADIDINQIVKKIVEEIPIPIEVYFKYDEEERKLKIERPKLKLPNDCEYMEDVKRGGLIMKTIEVFTKKFPNLVRHQYFQGADFFEMLGEIELPKKLNDYFAIIENTVVKRRLISSNDFNKLKNHLVEYVMNKLYEKIYPQDPTMNDSLTFKQCVMLSWAEPRYFINKKTNYVYDSFLPDVIAHFKQIHREKTPRKKMECIKNIFMLINNVIKFNDREGECGADDSTSILTYSLVQAQPFCIYSDLKFVELFFKDKMFKIEGNQLTQLLSACNLVCQLKGSNFKMDENEFNKRCQEFANNPNNNDDDEN